MKYLVLILALIITACSEDNSEKEIKKLKSTVRSLEADVVFCEGKLAQYKAKENSYSAETNTSEQEEPASPQYETVDSYRFKPTGSNSEVTCYEVDTEQACGLTFTECKDGFRYRCMQDVKYKIIEEQKLIE